MKKRFYAAAVAVLLTMGLTACSDSSTASVTSTAGGSAVSVAGMELNIPEDWTTAVGDKVYEILLESSDDSADTSSVEKFRKDCEENGVSYLVYAANSDKSAVLSVTSVNITTDETTGEKLTAEDYARQNHDTAVFSYQASGMYIRNSSFGEEQLAGKNGWLSHFEVCSDEETSQLIMGQSEFTFEQDGKYWSIQTYYPTESAAQEVDDILAGITAK